MKTQIDWNSVPLGNEPDHIIARRLGCRVATVGNYRRKKGIPAPKKDPQVFSAGRRASSEQIEQQEKRWESFPLSPTHICRQCEEDVGRYLNLELLKKVPCRHTEMGYYCLAHYAALPLCPSCGKDFTHRAEALCEACWRRIEIDLAAGTQEVYIEFGEEENDGRM